MPRWRRNEPKYQVTIFGTIHISCIICNPIHTFQIHSEQPPADNGGGEAPPGGLTDADIDSNWDEAIDSFDGMEIPEELLRGIYAYGFEKPSAIQQRAIKPTMLGRDLIAQAQSGTVSKRKLLRGDLAGLFVLCWGKRGGDFFACGEGE